MRRTHQHLSGLVATPELEEALRSSYEVQIDCGRYRATVVRSGRSYEAWTSHPPFVYGRTRPTLQEALDALEEAYQAREQDDVSTSRSA